MENQLLDDEAMDDLIAQNPAFLASIQQARQQKTNGQVRRLSELRQKYATETISTNPSHEIPKQSGRIALHPISGIPDASP